MNPMDGFQRNISYTLLEQDGDIVMTATMEDPLHDLTLEIIAEGTTLLVRSATVAFNKSPSPACAKVAARLERLTGITIGKGLEWKLKKALGCRNGCGNLLNLLQGLLPLALNYRASAGTSDEKEMSDAVHGLLLGTCAGYALPSAGKQGVK